jgi:hypothetical protein
VCGTDEARIVAAVAAAFAAWQADIVECEIGGLIDNGKIRAVVIDADRAAIQSFIPTAPLAPVALLVSQLALTEELFGRPLETVIYQNTDHREQPEGAELLIVHLASGIYLIGPNAGFNFSMIKSQIEEVYTYRGIEKGGQFRSRDVYPRLVAHLMDAMEDDLDLEETSSNTIPALDGFYIGHIDNFGNIKTTITSEWIKEKYNYDDQVKVRINSVEKEARFVTNFFGGTVGELVIFPGSSGVKDNPFMEIAVWQNFKPGSVAGSDAFRHPLPGMKVEIL